MNDDLKRTWQDTRFRHPSEETINDVTDGKRLTALQSLARRYKRFSIIALAFIPCSVGMLNLRLMPEHARVILVIGYALFFLISSVMDSWLSRGITSIDCSRMTVSEVAQKALFYRKRHLQFMIILIPIALALIGYIIFNSVENVYLCVGLIVGVLFGAALGLRGFFDFMADYRTLTD